MLLFELLLLVVPTIYILFNRRINAGADKTYLIGFFILLLLLHLIVDGARWQMIPAYIIWSIGILIAVRQQENRSVMIVRIAKITGLTLLFIPAAVLPSVLPVFDLPEPSGFYSVGTKDILFETDRDEAITSDPTDERRFMIKAWYPISEAEGKMDMYIDEGGRSGFAQKYGLPPSALNYLDKIDTHVYKDAPVSGEKFPVLLFSHGYHSKANGYYNMLSEIVSHGYIVFAVNHTYESTGSTFPDGTEVYFDNEYARKIEANTWETINPVVEAFQEDLNFEERHPIVQEALISYFAKDIVGRWARDIIDVVDKLEEWNQTDHFKGRLDITNVGVFGHSRGGGAAGESLLLDTRIKAGVNLDGIQWGQIVNTQFQQPFLLLASDWPDDHENLNQHAYINKSASVFYEGTLLESGHSNFMDIPFMIPLQALSLAGDINPNLASEITNKLTVTFFDKHLKNREADIQKVSAEYEELQMSIYRGNSMQSAHGTEK